MSASADRRRRRLLRKQQQQKQQQHRSCPPEDTPRNKTCPLCATRPGEVEAAVDADGTGEIAFLGCRPCLAGVSTLIARHGFMGLAKIVRDGLAAAG